MMLIKFSLSFMVVFSAVISYLLAPNIVEYDWMMIILLFVGRIAGNRQRQCSEPGSGKRYRRPDETHRQEAGGLRKNERAEGWTFAIIAGLAGVFILAYFFNWLSAVIAAISWFMYAFMYTPLKKVSSVSVLVGAVPGRFALSDRLGCRAG